MNVAGTLLDMIEGKDPATGCQVFQPVRLIDTQGLDSASNEEAFRFSFLIRAEAIREAAHLVLSGRTLTSVTRWMSDNHPPKRAKSMEPHQPAPSA
jgi:hypothetical protein